MHNLQYSDPTTLTGFLNTDKLARCLRASVECWREPSSWSRQASQPPWPHTLRNHFLLIESLSPGGSSRHVRLSKQANKLHMFGKLTRVMRALAPKLQKLRATALGKETYRKIGGIGWAAERCFDVLSFLKALQAASGLQLSGVITVLWGEGLFSGSDIESSLLSGSSPFWPDSC